MTLGTAATMHPQRTDFLSAKEAGRMLGVSYLTVKNWVDSGVVPAWRTAGGHRMIPANAIKRMSEEKAAMTHLGKHQVKGLRLDQSLRLLSISHDYELQHATAAFASSQDSAVFMATGSVFQGLIAFGKFQPNAVVVDLNLPDVDTLEMTRTLGRCKQPGYGHVLLAVTNGLLARAHLSALLGKSVTAVVEQRDLGNFLSKIRPCRQVS